MQRFANLKLNTHYFNKITRFRFRIVKQKKKLSRIFYAFVCEKACFRPIWDIFAFTSPSSEMQRSANLKLKYSLFQQNHVFSLQNSDAEQKGESDNAFVW